GVRLGGGAPRTLRDRSAERVPRVRPALAAGASPPGAGDALPARGPRGGRCVARVALRGRWVLQPAYAEPRLPHRAPRATAAALVEAARAARRDRARDPPGADRRMTAPGSSP